MNGSVRTSIMPYDERDEETGQFTSSFSHQEFLEAIEALSGQASTQEVADEVGCAYRTAYQKLTELEDDNEISSKKIANARLWILTSE